MARDKPSFHRLPAPTWHQTQANKAAKSEIQTLSKARISSGSPGDTGSTYPPTPPPPTSAEARIKELEARIREVEARVKELEAELEDMKNNNMSSAHSSSEIKKELMKQIEGLNNQVEWRCGVDVGLERRRGGAPSRPPTSHRMTSAFIW